jgi:hypothetical protein
MNSSAQHRWCHGVAREYQATHAQQRHPAGRGRGLRNFFPQEILSGAGRHRSISIAALLFSGYGALGLDGLAHYTLAFCSEYTLATNLTIWSEAIAGLVLMLVSALWLGRRVSDRNEHAAA